ncbi:hypothetical protein L198_02856 [Cryptococcus wingfieldii CBS 7118]|uniref:Uncharacterized protein n=1 Tax=Cryptococcus wingfieldii CBS 7118 TaxID=1295528 RepID=A0A1E3JK90_9TREE|nr:hypothetical protein L198_02856 [Cryptococcus wingfieldii CBS 7118]ODO00537.1 hypothetical protein L198_02856 [Cryptococcus wingfieldii CBS 7118]
MLPGIRTNTHTNAAATLRITITALPFFVRSHYASKLHSHYASNWTLTVSTTDLPHLPHYSSTSPPFLSLLMPPPKKGSKPKATPTSTKGAPSTKGKAGTKGTDKSKTEKGKDGKPKDGQANKKKK